MKRQRSYLLALAAVLGMTGGQAFAQKGAADGQWRYYGGDAGNTKYAPLDQINAGNVSKLQIAWRWKRDDLESLFEVTPLMVDGVLYTTASGRRDVVAL